MSPARSSVYGPSAGDFVHLGDTGLLLRVESDSDIRGDEFVVGFAKTARDGIHLKAASVAETCDLVVSDVVLLDPVLGCHKLSIGIRDGRIAALGRAGNPDTMDSVDVVVGTGTSIVSGTGLIATPGAIDTHVHLLSPRIMEASLASGVTTVIGQEFGPVWGVGVNSPWALSHAFSAFDAWPVNIGFLGRGASSHPAPLVEALEDGGACGFKVHEDLGAYPRSIDTALRVAEEYDVQVALHSDGLNEGMSVDDTIAVLEGRTVHAFHVEGCGGGHSPDVLRLAGLPNVIASSTNPTLPYARDALGEAFHMICVAHGLNKDVESDARIALDRIRGTTMGAEDVLHDLGLIPITSSDAQGMGRAGETVRRTFALAAKMKRERAPAPGEASGSAPGYAPGEESGYAPGDNERILRYLAKLTINPAIAHGLSHEVGSLAVGKLADIVLWDPRYFAAKPSLVLKAGFPAWGVTGDPNASIDSCEPLVIGPQFGAMGATPSELSVAFVSEAAVAAPPGALPTRRRRVAVKNCRGIGPTSMCRNAVLGTIEVDPMTTEVRLDGEIVSSEPAEQVCLSRLYFL
jgi:urease subunit alpha